MLLVNNMIYLITGATGLIGNEILRLCEQKEIFVHYLTTQKSKIKETKFVKGFYWNPVKNEIDIACLKGVSKIINLSGSTISKRWSSSYKKQIIESRVASVNLLVESLKNNKHTISQVISSSAIGIYPNSLTGFCNEENSEITVDNFLGEVVQFWEKAIDNFNELGIKTTKIRTGLVLSSQGGALPKIIKPIYVCLGAAFGKGKQWQSWIHINDIARIFLFTANKELEGVYNGVAPNPIRQNKLMKITADALGKPLWFPNIPEVVVKLIFGEMSLLLLSSQRVCSNRILNEGFSFNYNTIESAISNIIETKV